MSFAEIKKQITEREKTSAVSYFLTDRLEVIFLKTSADGRREIQDKLWIPVSDSLSEKDAAGMRAQIAGKYNTSWIHIVMRQGGFVKTFSVPDLPAEKLDVMLVQKVQEEMPHLANDILYHIGMQKTDMPERREALLFGISKAALEDQLTKLERFGVVPDSVMLSTEVLFGYYRNLPAAETSNAMLIHEAGRQLELIYVNQGRLIQSRWFKKDAYDQDGIESVLQIANESLQREGQPLPGRALLLGGDLKMTSSANGIPFEFLKDRDASSEDGDPVLWKAALNAYQTASVFDFTPPVWEKKRRDRRLAKERTSLFLWVVVFSAALCFLALTRVLSVGIESAWLAFKRAPLTESIKDLKALQTKALSAGTYQQRKIFPVLLLEKLRAAVPAGVLLVKLEYDQASALFLMRGESVSENFIHDFLGALQKQPLLTGLKLDRVEARQEDGGRIYEFEIKGFLGSRSPA